jgi:branched-subunit amino acid transport protein AzlD
MIIAVVAVCTLITRLIPFVLFGGKRKVPEAVNYLGNILPPAIMATLVVYCLKGADIFSSSHGLPEFIATAVVAALHAWKRNVLLSIAAGTLLYMFLVQVVF